MKTKSWAHSRLCGESPRRSRRAERREWCSWRSVSHPVSGPFWRRWCRDPEPRELKPCVWKKEQKRLLFDRKQIIWCVYERLGPVNDDTDVQHMDSLHDLTVLQIQMKRKWWAFTSKQQIIDCNVDTLMVNTIINVCNIKALADYFNCIYFQKTRINILRHFAS